jgi:hypothetical protein
MIIAQLEFREPGVTDYFTLFVIQLSLLSWCGVGSYNIDVPFGTLFYAYSWVSRVVGLLSKAWSRGNPYPLQAIYWFNGNVFFFLSS